MGIELEWKYSADAQTLERIRAARPGAYRRIEMRTTYYDTPEGGFSGRLWTLRHRMENGDGVCTLKIPAPGGARREYEAPAEGLGAGVAALLEQGAPKELEALATAAVPVCQAAFVRLALTVELEEAVVELALDRGILRGRQREQAFAETEVELKAGSVEAGHRFAQALAEEFGLKSEPLSKFARASRL